MKKKGKILIVDDSEALLGLISEMLTAEHYSIDTASSGEDALMFLKKVTPDLILLDRTLPGIDGFEVCRLIKKNSNLKKIPIIFLTATNDVKDKVEGFRIGAVDYITKPFQKEELLARVNSHIELYKLSKLLKDQAEILRKSEKRLKELNATKDTFFSIIAHDLKGPMINLLELTKLAKFKFLDGDKQLIEELLEHLLITAENTNELLVTLLDWASIQQDKMPFNPQKLLLFNVVNESVKVLESNSRAKNISIKNLTNINTNVFADLNMIQTILRNLISNAIKFTPRGGSIIVSNYIQGDSINICVKDTGVGIEAHKTKSLFQISKSKSTHGTQGETGTGLGLVLCKEFVEKHNGKIWVESEEGKGSEFWISFPNT